MRILDIKNNHAIIEVEKTELDKIVNEYLDLQYKIGYEEGYNDWMRINNANMDDDWSEDDS